MVVNSEPCLAIELGLQLDLGILIEAGHRFKKKKNSWIEGINLYTGRVCAFVIEGLGESGGKWR